MNYLHKYGRDCNIRRIMPEGMSSPEGEEHRSRKPDEGDREKSADGANAHPEDNRPLSRASRRGGRWIRRYTTPGIPKLRRPRKPGSPTPPSETEPPPETDDTKRGPGNEDLTTEPGVPSEVNHVEAIAGYYDQIHEERRKIIENAIPAEDFQRYILLLTNSPMELGASNAEEIFAVKREKTTLKNAIVDKARTDEEFKNVLEAIDAPVGAREGEEKPKVWDLIQKQEEAEKPSAEKFREDITYEKLPEDIRRSIELTGDADLVRLIKGQIELMRNHPRGKPFSDQEQAFIREYQAKLAEHPQIQEEFKQFFENAQKTPEPEKTEGTESDPGKKKEAEEIDAEQKRFAEEANASLMKYLSDPTDVDAMNKVFEHMELARKHRDHHEKDHSEKVSRWNKFWVALGLIFFLAVGVQAGAAMAVTGLTKGGKH